MSHNEPTTDERIADALEDLGSMFHRAFSLGATGSPLLHAGLLENNAVVLHEKLDSLTMVVGDLVRAVDEVRDAIHHQGPNDEPEVRLEDFMTTVGEGPKRPFDPTQPPPY